MAPASAEFANALCLNALFGPKMPRDILERNLRSKETQVLEAGKANLLVRIPDVKAGRGVAAVAWLMVLPIELAAQAPIIAEASAPELPAAPAARVLMLSDQARRFLALQNESSRVEFMGCMIGDVRGGAVWVDRIAPADVAPSQATATWVVPTQTCEQAGWAGTVGVIHSHPSAAQCWYHFPNTRVPTSDGQSFLHGPYPVDAILCGTRVVWISRDMTEQEMPLIAALAQKPVAPTAP